MTNEQILEQVSKLEKGLNNPNVPESAKTALKGKIADLKSQLKEAEEKVEKKEVEAEKKEEKVQNELEATIAKLEKGLNNPNVPESAKDAIKKKIAAAKEELAKQKEEIKEDKAESKKEKAKIKEAVEKVEKLSKKKKPAKEKKVPAPKKIEIPEVKHEERQEKSKKRKSRLDRILTDLEALINKNKGLKAKYEGKGVDLKRDAGRSAKPFGWRFVGKHDYRDPKKVLTDKQFAAAKKSGKIDYEGRANRSDKFPSGYRKKVGVKLAKGGEVHDKAKDAQRFAKPAGWRWKDEAVTDGIITKSQLSVEPSKRMRSKHPDYVYQEARVSKSDKNPSRRFKSLGSGGSVHDKAKDAQRFAKPAGWRWKDEAVTEGIIAKSQLSVEPSKRMRSKHPDYVYQEARVSKSDKNPSRKFKSLGSGGEVYANNGDLRNDWEKHQSADEMIINTSHDSDVNKDFPYILEINDSSYFYASKKERDHDYNIAKKVSKMKKGGVVHDKAKDAQRFAKPSGWRWKDEAVTSGVVSKSKLSTPPSKFMRKKYPELVYKEARVSKSDKHPSRKFKSL